MYIFSAPDMCGDSFVDALNGIQRFVLLRSWSAKLFEFFEFISELKPDGVDEAIIASIRSEALAEFDALKATSGHDLARYLRNEATSHYPMKAARKNLRHIAEDANLSFVLHEMDGNSFYPLGEEVMFSGRLNRFTSSRKTREEKMAASEEWMDYNMKVTRWLKNVHIKLVEELLLSHFPDRKLIERTLWLPAGHVANFDEFSVPIFVRKRDR